MTAADKLTCAECGLEGECECSPRDSIAALGREDVEAAIAELRAAADGDDDADSLAYSARLARVADALAEHLIDRHDA